MRKLFLTTLSSLLVLIAGTSFPLRPPPPFVLATEKVLLTTNPQTGRIYINGVLAGAGRVEVTVPKNDCVKVEVKLEGYVQETRNYCDRKGMSSPPNSDYIQLQADESYTSSVESSVANTEILLSV